MQPNAAEPECVYSSKTTENTLVGNPDLFYRVTKVRPPPPGLVRNLDHYHRSSTPPRRAEKHTHTTPNGENDAAFYCTYYSYTVALGTPIENVARRSHTDEFIFESFVKHVHRRTVRKT